MRSANFGLILSIFQELATILILDGLSIWVCISYLCSSTRGHSIFRELLLQCGEFYIGLSEWYVAHICNEEIVVQLILSLRNGNNNHNARASYQWMVFRLIALLLQIQYCIDSFSAGQLAVVWTESNIIRDNQMDK